MKKLLAFALVAMMAGVSFGAWGFYDADRSWVVLDDGSGPAGYSLWNSGAGTFQGADLGMFDLTVDSFTLTGIDTKTFKNGSSDVTGTEYFYTIYTGTRPKSPTFTSLGGGFLQDYGSGNQQWGATGLTVDLLAGLSAGTSYTLEIYGMITGNDDGNPLNNYNQYDNNNNAPANYTATFDTAPAAIPEPATMSLLGLGALAMVLRRKISK
jgi:hypothetical protein